jgi:hypothetical protein
LLFIGDDGSGGGLGFDLRNDPPPVLLVDYSSSGWSDALFQATTFSAFLENFADRGWDFDTPYRPAG